MAHLVRRAGGSDSGSNALGPKKSSFFVWCTFFSSTLFGSSTLLHPLLGSTCSMKPCKFSFAFSGTSNATTLRFVVVFGRLSCLLRCPDNRDNKWCTFSTFPSFFEAFFWLGQASGGVRSQHHVHSGLVGGTEFQPSLGGYKCWKMLGHLSTLRRELRTPSGENRL